MPRSMEIALEAFPIAGSFTISRGSKTSAHVIVCSIFENGATGRGECVPYGRYGESLDGVVDAIEDVRAAVISGITREELQKTMPAGAARNAVDCALWDLQAKQGGTSVSDLLGLRPPEPVVTAYTISLGTAEEMAIVTAQNAHRPILKVKVGTNDDAARIRAVRRAAPRSKIILDANEGWTEETIRHHLAIAAEEGVALIEQPLPAGKDEALSTIDRPVAVCADESVHSQHDLLVLKGRYDAVNIKLDKTGGLTEALALKKQAQAAGFQIMVGCMVATSLAMAPAVLLAQDAAFVDLDGPLLLARDRQPALNMKARQSFRLNLPCGDRPGK